MLATGLEDLCSRRRRVVLGDGSVQDAIAASEAQSDDAAKVHLRPRSSWWGACRPRAMDRRVLAVVGLALAAHQLRDATRRGLWLWPLGAKFWLPSGSSSNSSDSVWFSGSTAPLSRTEYLTLLLAAPLLARLIMRPSGKSLVTAR